MIKICLLRLLFALFFIAGSIFLGIGACNSYADSGDACYEVKPWNVGQFVVYKIISMEGEDADNRYSICLDGQEEIDGKKYFWVKIDIWENIVSYGYNTIRSKLKKNISFKALIPPKDTVSFINNPPRFISSGVFPKGAKKLMVQVGEGKWHNVDPKSFFNHQEIIDSTPYSMTPHARGKINFGKLTIDKIPRVVQSPAGKIPCYRFSVDTKASDCYWDEGFYLWRSPKVPILGIVKMEFSRTRYWKKWAYKNSPSDEKTPLGYLKSLYKRRVPGRRRPDTVTIELVDYGSK